MKNSLGFFDLQSLFILGYRQHYVDIQTWINKQNVYLYFI